MREFDSKWPDVPNFSMGISHADFSSFSNGVQTMRLEHTIIDETAIWKQILLQTGQHE